MNFKLFYNCYNKMFSKTETKREFGKDHNSAQVSSRSELNRAQSQEVFGTLPAHLERRRGPAPTTYTLDANSMADLSKQKAIRSVFRSDQNAPFNAKTERFSAPKT